MEKSVSFDITWSHPCMSALIQRRGPTARARGKKGMSESLRVNFQKGPVAELKNSAAGFFLPTEIIRKKNAVKSEGASAKTSATDQTQAVCLRLCGQGFCFLKATRSFSEMHGSGAGLVPVSSTAFSSQKLKPKRRVLFGHLPYLWSESGGIQSHF